MPKQPAEVEFPESFGYDRCLRVETVAGVAYELVMLRDFEATVTELCDRVIAGADRRWFEELCPMFGVIWPAARALADTVARDRPAGLKVLELGCGLGLPSLVAARCGAQVIATDQHPHARGFLLENQRRNGVEVQFEALDWRGPAPPGVVERGFDRVLASDVAYAADMPEKVAAAFDRFLAPTGRGWLTDPGRPWLDRFADEARARGMTVEVDVRGDTRADEVFVLTLAR
ncbi:MAG: methyltransferase domain-containing protein [Myxococcota bacterium]